MAPKPISLCILAGVGCCALEDLGLSKFRAGGRAAGDMARVARGKVILILFCLRRACGLTFYVELALLL